jgi:hypothetical protein
MCEASLIIVADEAATPLGTPLEPDVSLRRLR